MPVQLPHLTEAERREELPRAVHRAIQEINKHEPRLTAAESDITALEARVDTAETDIVALEAADVAMDTRVDALEGRQIIAGAGLTGGGTLAADRTFNVVAADATIVVNADSVQAGVMQTANLASNAATNAIIRDSGALSVIGRSANSTGDPGDISASASSGAVLRESGGVVGFGTVATAGIDNDAITDAKLRNGGACSVIGRSANSSGDPADISASTNGHFLSRQSNAVGFAAITNTDLPARRFSIGGTALVAGDFALSAAFGATATVDNISGTDSACRFRVLANGAGVGANGTITLTFKDGTWTSVPFIMACRSGGSQPAVAIGAISSTATTWQLTWTGTAVAGEGYFFNVWTMG